MHVTNRHRIPFRTVDRMAIGADTTQQNFVCVITANLLQRSQEILRVRLGIPRNPQSVEHPCHRVPFIHSHFNQSVIFFGSLNFLNIEIRRLSSGQFAIASYEDNPRGERRVSTTAQQHYSITALQHHSTTALQHNSTTASQHYSITALQHHSTTAQQHISATALQHSSITAISLVFLMLP